MSVALELRVIRYIVCDESSPVCGCLFELYLHICILHCNYECMAGNDSHQYSGSKRVNVQMCTSMYMLLVELRQYHVCPFIIYSVYIFPLTQKTISNLI